MDQFDDDHGYESGEEELCCDSCGHLEWYDMDEIVNDEEVECPSCGGSMR